MGARIFNLVFILLASLVTAFVPKRPAFSASWAIYSLRPAAEPLMDSGKALARSGELLIELTTDMDLYGGALSATGAQIRNAGDCVAQAAASMRFKTAAELVCDELREAGTCLIEGAVKLKLAVEEAETDSMSDLAKKLSATIEPTRQCGDALEATGAGIMQQATIEKIGEQLASAGRSLNELSALVGGLEASNKNGELSGQRMKFAADKITEAGNNLQGIKPKPKGKSWLKGGA